MICGHCTACRNLVAPCENANVQLHMETCATRYPRGPGLGLGPCDCSRELLDGIVWLARSRPNDADLGAAVRAWCREVSP